MTGNEFAILQQLAAEARDDVRKLSESVQQINDRLSLGNQRFDALERMVMATAAKVDQSEVERKADFAKISADIEPVINIVTGVRATRRFNRLIPGGILGGGLGAYAKFRGWW